MNPKTTRAIANALKAHNLIRRELSGTRRADVRAHGANLTETLLLCLTLAEPPKCTDLARHLDCSTANVTKIADALEAAGLAYRVIERGDRRVIRIAPTAKAHALFDAEFDPPPPPAPSANHRLNPWLHRGFAMKSPEEIARRRRTQPQPAA